jgi:putative transposase
MPAHLKRYQQTGHLHFITFSCYDRKPYLLSAEAMDTFERSLEAMRLRYEFCIGGYVVMPEHVHLLITEPRCYTLATALQAVKISVARRLTQRPFWQRRYYDFNVFDDSKRIEKLKYIHRNPVARGLVNTPSEWRWSSFNHYATGLEGIVEIESNWTSGRREGLTLPAALAPPTSTGKERR